MTNPIMSINEEFKKKHEAMRKSLDAISKASGSKAASAAASDYDESKQAICAACHDIFDESMEMYEDGSLSFEEMTADLMKALKEVPKHMDAQAADIGTISEEN